VTGITHATALWYMSRATGVVTLVLLTAVVILGMLVNRQGRLPGLPRFAVTGLHRNISLLSVIFLVIHVVTAIADPYVTIGWAATVIPFTSPYEPFWLGLGALSLDLMAALILTSLVRGRISRRVWRGIHWLAYAAWPLAVVHSVGSSADMRSGVLLGVLIGCVLAACAAAAWRLSHAARQTPRARRATAALAQMSPAAPPRHAAPGLPHDPANRPMVTQEAGQR
jgi:methionine sulfoxide reductase heme-binding subunit